MNLVDSGVDLLGLIPLFNSEGYDSKDIPRWDGIHTAVYFLWDKLHFTRSLEVGSPGFVGPTTVFSCDKQRMVFLDGCS